MYRVLHSIKLFDIFGILVSIKYTATKCHVKKRKTLENEFLTLTRLLNQISLVQNFVIDRRLLPETFTDSGRDARTRSRRGNAILTTPPSVDWGRS